MTTTNCILSYSPRRDPIYKIQNDLKQSIRTNILWKVSETRPDLILKSIDQLKFEDYELNEVKVKCIRLVPHVAINIANIKNWMLQNNGIFNTNPYVKKIIDAVQIPPNHEMLEIFDVFKKFAEPEACAIQLEGRDLWLKYGELKSEGLEKNSLHEKKIEIFKELRNIEQLVVKAQRTRCITTGNAIQSAIFGITNNQISKIILSNEEFSESKLDKEIWSLIKENEKNFEGKPLSYFFSYYFLSLSLNHVFFIIQHRDVEDNIRYRILQSWVDEHGLHKYMTERESDLSSDEFICFSKGFNHVLFNEETTPFKEIFYEHYFMKKYKNVSYDDDEERQQLHMKWGASDGVCIKHYINEYHAFLDEANNVCLENAKTAIDV